MKSLAIPSANVRFYIGDEYVGEVSHLQTEMDEASALDGNGLIVKSWVTDVWYEIYMLGAIFELNQVSYKKIDDNNIELHATMADIREARFYPSESEHPFSTMYEKVVAAQINYSVYNETTSGFHTFAPGGFVQNGGKSEQDKLHEALPGLNEEVDCPVCGDNDTVWETVQHINDHHRWKREQIADWLDTLDVDLTFQIGEENGN